MPQMVVKPVTLAGLGYTLLTAIRRPGLSGSGLARAQICRAPAPTKICSWRLPNASPHRRRGASSLAFKGSVGDEAAFDGGGLDRLLQLFEGAHLDLTDALARDAVLL